MDSVSRDIHWFNTVKISRSAVEAALGPSKVDQRARQFFILGASLSPLFDIASATDFFKALLKLLEDWDSWLEGVGANKGMVGSHASNLEFMLIGHSPEQKNLFRGQKTGRKPNNASGISDYSTMDNESHLLTYDPCSSANSAYLNLLMLSDRACIVC